MHDFTVNHLSEDQSELHFIVGPEYVPQPAYGLQEDGPGGVLSRFMAGGFGQAIVGESGFGIGDDLINGMG